MKEMKRSGRKLIVAALLVTMQSQTLYAAAAGVFGLRAQSYAYADDEEVSEAVPGEDIEFSAGQEEKE